MLRPGQNTTPPHPYVFGRFRFEPAEHLLTRDGQPVALPPKAIDLLALLVAHAGHLLTKEELLKQVWPGTFVEEANLSYTISLLRKALGDDQIPYRFVETVPRRGYRFVAAVEDVSSREATPVESEAVQRARRSTIPPWFRRRVPIAAIAGGLLVLVAVGWLLKRSRPQPVASRVLALTTLPGFEAGPSFSPDGEQVAFVWGGDKQDNVDIYVKIVGSSEIRRLTTNPDPDGNPAWSPDGRQIAFMRYGSTGARIHRMSALGSPDLKVSDFPAASNGIAWSPDGRSIAAMRDTGAAIPRQQNTGIYLIPLQGGEPRHLTTPKAPGMDEWPAFSPDGRHLAYVSCLRWDGSCDVYVLELDAAFGVNGPPRRLTHQAIWDVWGVAWTRDSKSVVYDTHVGTLARLWRVDIDGSGPPERIELAGLRATQPATVASRDRLAFSELGNDRDVFRFEAGHPAQPWLASSFSDAAAQFSHDGRRIVFASGRSGDAVEVWVATADGSSAQQLTHGPGPWQGAPSWSPDDRHIAFDSMAVDGRWHIWTIDAEGGPPRQVTNDPGEQNVPTWSRDGRWIYFSVDEGAGRQIWRVRAGGGHPEQITQAGSGYFAREAADGKSLLYQSGFADLALLTLPLGGGSARQLVDCVQPGSFEDRPEGTYYVGCGDDPPVHLLERITGHKRLLGTLEKFSSDATAGLSVSPDGKAFLFARPVRTGADLMLIENFR
jgi:Tol biopolymer transport system component/DNA-binding winged helix-turn-helix (wHTH) protein